VATNYEINYNDERFTEVEADKKAAIAEVNKTYDSMINQSDKYYQAQIDASKKWADTQTKLQNERTDFAIEQIEQQKDQAHKDYTKEQSGAYVDWQKQSNEYGANAEAMAAQGMANTGYSESSQVSMYNTYQNRVATARESYNRAVLNYDNAIKDARLQNNAALAEIAYNALQTQLELSLEGFQYKNTLVMAKTDAKRETDNNYYNRYQDVLKQINTENSLAEEVRQYNESLAEERRQFNQNYSLQQSKLAEEKRQFNETMAYNKAKSSGGSSGGSGGSVKKSSGGSVKKSSSSKDTSAHYSTVKDREKNASTASAYTYLNKLISSGASKDKVSNEIAIALREGAISKTEAQKLRNTFTPRGIAY
jgi:hypothetical protein